MPLKALKQKKYDTNEFIYKTETETRTQKTDYEKQ